MIVIIPRLINKERRLLQPQALVDKLSRYKKSLEEVDLREKQLAAMRIDICNAENLKKLKGARFLPSRPPRRRPDRRLMGRVSLLQIRLEGRSFQRTLRKGAHNSRSSSSCSTATVKRAPRSCRSSATPTSSMRRSTRRSKLLLT